MFQKEKIVKKRKWSKRENSQQENSPKEKIVKKREGESEIIWKSASIFPSPPAAPLNSPPEKANQITCQLSQLVSFLN